VGQEPVEDAGGRRNTDACGCQLNGGKECRRDESAIEEHFSGPLFFDSRLLKLNKMAVSAQ
jgi:hypothetical protein